MNSERQKTLIYLPRLWLQLSDFSGCENGSKIFPEKYFVRPLQSHLTDNGIWVRFSCKRFLTRYIESLILKLVERSSIQIFMLFSYTRKKHKFKAKQATNKARLL